MLIGLKVAALFLGIIFVLPLVFFSLIFFFGRYFYFFIDSNSWVASLDYKFIKKYTK